METTTHMIFITGGVRSGKSSFAEKMALEKAISRDGNLHYIATGLPSDTEMNLRIEKHKQQRHQCNQNWKTWEQSENIGLLADNFTNKDILLLDCLTTLLNNELFSDETAHNKRMIGSILSGIERIRKNCDSLIIVSNEILNEPLQTNELVLSYKKMLGHLHQEIVKQSDEAFLVESGVPILMKGGADERDHDSGNSF
ncbi:bifunctional adenosylcobinamide kinase/adenosylcobinamide-phosphate guanylyltransferase [Bacillus sp. Marseille-Q3570]|uniref:bifunctional adenosylcobinamide kinase/adenosylcobinamide-phosphate guanylyltransferase n=1 Tax=Bacillus sp. Marseille-Q3570 TaxID=2963522 RepID=UPI0021B731CD|nr:bifunctional adenosylcobinamide kinase/adenosylcobinamide-phosphate guanylyltransferase [Bacillus sp. Marseille-Q3570]